MKRNSVRPAPPAHLRPSGKGLARPAAVSQSQDGLSMLHERDQGHGQVAAQPDPVIEQASRDLQAGQVDTDMRATPGLDAERRGHLVDTPSRTQPARQPPRTGSKYVAPKRTRGPA